MIIGFSGRKISIIEIICIIIILLVLIIMGVSGISSLIGENSVDSREQKEDMIVAEAEEYYLKNFKNSLAVGEKYKIDLAKLQKGNYLDVDLSQKCINNSWVDVYLNNDQKYLYIPHISCFYDDIFVEEYPIINTFTNNNIISIQMLSSNIQKYITLSSYQVIIEKDNLTVYNSNLIYIDDKELNIELDLADYTDDFDDIKVSVIVENNIGKYSNAIVNL